MLESLYWKAHFGHWRHVRGIRIRTTKQVALIGEDADNLLLRLPTKKVKVTLRYIQFGIIVAHHVQYDFTTGDLPNRRGPTRERVRSTRCFYNNCPAIPICEFPLRVQARSRLSLATPGSSEEMMISLGVP